MRKAKKPTSAMVTATIAAMRGAPSVLANSSRPCTGRHLPRKTLRAAHSARFAQFMVSAGLIAAGDGRQNRSGAKSAAPTRERDDGVRRAEKKIKRRLPRPALTDW